MLREPEDMSGDFPVWYGLAVDASLVNRVPRALPSVSQALGIVAISDADEDEDMTLHLPDGSSHVVHLEQDDDDAFRITPEIQRLIERAGRPAPGTEGSPAAPSQGAERRKAIAG